LGGPNPGLQLFEQCRVAGGERDQFSHGFAFPARYALGLCLCSASESPCHL
jgi:hypothetical protein